MITDGKKWHYYAVKKLSALLRGITSKHNGDFYCLNCFCSFRTENALKNHENVCKDHDYCYIEMPDKDNNIVKYNPGEKSMKIPFVIYGDLECLLEKMSTCCIGPEKSSTIKLNKHTSSGFSLFTHCSFDMTKKKLDYYRGENCMKVFCKVLKEHDERKMYWEKKEMIPLTDEENRSYENEKCSYICKKRFTKENKKVRDHCNFTGKYRGATHGKCNMNYKITKDITIVFHNLSSYDSHPIIKELANEFDGELECLRENAEKCITFSVRVNKKITKRAKDGGEKILNIPYKLKFIESYKFMLASLSNHVDNLSDGLHNNKCTNYKCGLDS